MLSHLRIENFKAWNEADLTFGKVTGFFGPNSVGKSSLLQFLLLLKQTRNATDRGIVIDFGGPHSLVDLVNARLRARDLAYRFEDVDFRLRLKDGPKKGYELEIDPEIIIPKRIRGRAWPLPQPVKTHLFPGQARSYFQNTDFLAQFELAYEQFMDSIHHLGPLRDFPRREYPWAGARPSDVGQRGERAMEAILAATRSGEKRNLGYKKRRMPFQEMIAWWLRELGLIHDFRVEEIAPGANLYRAVVQTTPSSVPTPLTDVGIGVSQLLPVLVLPGGRRPCWRLTRNYGTRGKLAVLANPSKCDCTFAHA